MTTLQTPMIQTKEATWLIRNSQIKYKGKKYVSEELYWEKYYDHDDFNYEWNNGYLEEKPLATYRQSTIHRWFSSLLDQYLTIHPTARSCTLDIGFRMNLLHKIAIRKPDLAVVLNNNLIPLGDDDRSYKGTYDLCVEVLSTSSKKEINRDIVVKYGEYQSVGIEEYYILDDRGIETMFLQNVGGIYQPIQAVNGVIQSTVLPGFQFREDDLYRQPTLIELSLDPVYQGYVLPEYRQERLQRKQAQQQAEQERQDKNKLAAKLRELGIDPATIL
jgi:Uma2 family endonuclease